VYACDVYRSPSREYSESGQYAEIYLNSDECDSLHIVSLEIVDSGIYIPNIFRGTRSGVNDCFYISTINDQISTYRLSIFDRWGNMVFRSENINDCWDGTFRGKECAIGVYIYLLEIDDPGCGLRRITGDVTLVR
jgi:gliding motility-associated-like protein